MTDNIAQLKEWIHGSARAAFLGGAGVSVASGIPDFRSAGGLYAGSYQYPPEYMLSHKFFMEYTEEFYAFYRRSMLYPDAKPNDAHKALSVMERKGHLAAVVTQNIDGLHQTAGSQRVLELHGSVLRNRCMDCGKGFGLVHIMATEGVPRCSCSGIIKPDVVLYGEELPRQTLTEAVNAVNDADMLIVGGTSLAVYPAAGLIDYFKGDKLVIINKSPTPRDGMASLIIRQEVETALMDAVGAAL